MLKLQAYHDVNIVKCGWKGHGIDAGRDIAFVHAVKEAV